MNFRDQLIEYMTLIGCTNKELADAAGIGTGTVGRWRTGKNEPSPDSELLGRLIDGLYRLAVKNGVGLSREAIAQSLRETLHTVLTVDYDTFIGNLNTLLQKLDIRGGELARHLNFDQSYIYRILNGTRRPAEPDKFTSNIARYIVGKYGKGESLFIMASLFGRDAEELAQEHHLYDAIIAWLGSNSPVAADDPMQQFLEKLDAFSLDEYIRIIRFDDIKLTTLPFQLPTTKVYCGLREMMESELDFMKATILSKSMQDCILYSDMPMEVMAKDPDFPKKWMMGRAMMLKKGLHLIIIHNVNRPFAEMMLGLEGYIPMYMTGQIAPYYLPKATNDVFHHFLNVSGAAALVGDAIAGHHEKGRYTLTKSKEDVSYFREKAELLLSKALPLMQTYRSDKAAEFQQVLRQLWQEESRRMTFSSLPLFTMSEELLQKILLRNGASLSDRERIMAYHAAYRDDADKLLQKYRISMKVPLFTETAFHENPPCLCLSEIFVEEDICYTYEEYKQHLQQTFFFAEQYENCHIQTSDVPSFRNISFSIIGSKCVVVSKDKSPTIHFVIHHPKMVQAFKNFIPPIVDASTENKA